MISKIGIVLVLILSLSALNSLQAQYQYSIDIGRQRLTVAAFKVKIGNAKETIKANFEYRKKKRIENKTSRKIRKHAYSIQCREVKKRMRKSKRIAECHNKDKVPVSIKIKKMMQWMM